MAILLLLVGFSSAEELLFWFDSGRFSGNSQTFLSEENGFQGTSATEVIQDPFNTNRFSITCVTLDGDAGTASEFASVRVGQSPFTVSGARLWSDRIEPGTSTFRITVEVYVPDTTSLGNNDRVLIVARFYNDSSTFGDRREFQSNRVTAPTNGGWVQLELTGTIPVDDQQGRPITQFEPLIATTDFDNDANTDPFCYLNNIQVTVNVPDPSSLPPHQVVLDPATMDQDGNGLADIWEALYDASALNPDADDDGDGVSNRQESLAGTNPFDAQDSFYLRIESESNNQATVCWPNLVGRPGQLENSPSLEQDSWSDVGGTPTVVSGERRLDVSTGSGKGFFRVRGTATDSDSDQVPDWLEEFLGFQTGGNEGNSAGQPVSYDTDGDGTADTTLSGDLAVFNELYRQSSPDERPTRAQAARFLMQATFGPTLADIDEVTRLGYREWIDQQKALPISLTRPLIDQIKTHFNNGGDGANPGSLPNYRAERGPPVDFVRDTNWRTSWSRNILQKPDQLRQRVAFALSQILVTSRANAAIANQPRAVADYYDLFMEEAFGNYEDLLNKVTRHPVMGLYLSHLGNRKANPAIGRFPDENFAREIMQLFTIGLFELNPDGTLLLDNDGDPVPTYGNFEITELARVFTGVHYQSGNFGAGYRDDGDSNGAFMVTPMKIFASAHDFGEKALVDDRNPNTTDRIPARAENDANALQDVEDAVAHLVRHPNTAPFICRQLIQFLVTSNPTPGYVERVASVFVDNGSGVVGDLGAVIDAILLDDEARSPIEHLGNQGFGLIREPTVRTMHLARVMNLGRFDRLSHWDWGQYRERSLQEPMGSPTVFNYYRPDYRQRGLLASEGLDSPAFQIVDTYSAISFPNELWGITDRGFRQTGGAGYSFPPDWSALASVAGDIPELMDRLNLIFCAGSMSARSRELIIDAIQPVTNNTNRARLAAYLALNCPDGVCQK